MNRVDSNLRLHTSDDPYHHLVDNLPIKELLDKCILLQNQISTRPNPTNFKTESEITASYVQKSGFVGRKLDGISNVNATAPEDGSILKKTSTGWETKNPKTNPLDWYAECVADVVNDGEYLSINSNLEVSSTRPLNLEYVGKISDLDVAPNPANDDALLWNATTSKWQPRDIKTLSTGTMDALLASQHTGSTDEYLAEWSDADNFFTSKASFDGWFTPTRLNSAASADVNGSDSLTVFPDGFCIQTGKIYSSSDSALRTHTFTHPFSQIYLVVCSEEISTSPALGWRAITIVDEINAAYFKFRVHENDISMSNGYVHFMAIGKI